MFAAAILGTVTSINLRSNGVKTNATIVNVSTNFSRHSANSYSYTDLIRFTTADRQASIRSRSAARAAQHVGDAVAVIYDPSDPGTVQSASSLSGLWWVTPVVLLFFAVLLGWLGRRLWRTRSSAAQGAMLGEF